MVVVVVVLDRDLERDFYASRNVVIISGEKTQDYARNRRNDKKNGRLLVSKKKFFFNGSNEPRVERITVLDGSLVREVLFDVLY